MKIFEKRPLALILCIMLGVFSLFASCALYIKIIVSSLTLAALGVSFIKKWFSRKTSNCIRLICAAIVTAILLSLVWTIAFFPRRFYNESVDITGKVISGEYNGNSYKLTVKTDTVNKEKATYKIQLYYSEIDDLKIGDTVRLIGEINEIDPEHTYLLSNGISATLNDITLFNYTRSDDSDMLSFQGLRSRITDFFIDATDVNTGGLLSALVIGDRSYLDSNTSLNFRRVGISHILALSGMHWSIVMHAFERILLALRIKKSFRVAITSVFTFLYMAMVGFTPSITRAGIMLIIYYVLYLLAHSRDSFTSLSIAVFVIVLASPHSIFDTSLWLSSFATLGIITLSEMQSYKPKGNIAIRSFRWLYNMLFSSFFAIGCTLVITATSFQTISVISIFTTIIFSPLIEFLIYLGFSLLLLGNIPFLAKATTLFCNFISTLVERVADKPWVLSSTNFGIVKALIIIFTVLLIAFLIFNIKSKKSYVALLVVLFSSIFLTAALCTSNIRNSNEANYLTEKSNEAIILKDSGEIALFFPEQFNSSSSFYARTITQAEGITYVDKIILSSYNSYLSSNLVTYLKSFKVKEILLPTPLNNSELKISGEIISEIKKYHCECVFYDLYEEVDLNNSSIKVLSRPQYNGESHNGYVSLIKTGNSQTAYISDGATNAITISDIRLINESDNIIVGYGKKNDFDLKLNGISKIYVTDKNKLSESVISAYKKSGTDIIEINNKIFLGE